MGGAVASEERRLNSRIPFAHGMGLISDELYEVFLFNYMKFYNLYRNKIFHHYTYLLSTFINKILIKEKLNIDF